MNGFQLALNDCYFVNSEDNIRLKTQSVSSADLFINNIAEQFNPLAAHVFLSEFSFNKERKEFF